MTDSITHTVQAPGAVLTYDVREPETPREHRPLFIFGSPMGGSGFEQLVSHFRDRTVITYDPRGMERSTREPDSELTGVKLSRLRSKKEHMFLTHEQVAKLAASAGPYATLIRTLTHTGLRWGEVTALRARDVDLGRRRLDVRRTFADIGGRVVEGMPKSHRSRTVPLPRLAVCRADSSG